jgi:uncharacterized protein
MDWSRKAAEQGSVEAQRNLGYFYIQGIGVAADLRQAADWYRKAAEQGDAISQANLGILYEGGRGVSKDERMAVEWYRKAAEQGHTSAENNLGSAYENGEGTLQDHAEAAKWYERAARQGDAWGQRNLARLLRDGQILAQSVIQAHAWFNLASAAEESHPDAAKERDELAAGMSAAQLAEAQRLAREWKSGAAMGTSKVNGSLKKKTAAASPKVTAEDLFPAKPAKRPGVTSCNTRCINGDCFRTYDSGKKVRVQAERRYDMMKSEWIWDSGNC